MHSRIVRPPLRLLNAGTLALLLPGPLVWAADEPASGTQSQVQEIVVTGSRIRQDESQQPTPITVLDPQQFEDRGYVQAGQALNEDPSITPQLALTPFNGQASTPAFQYPNLFNLGYGRTLTLINGMRTISTANGLQDAGVDTNTIPLGLIKRIDVVQGTGAAVYGSDAIAGVINYILQDHFTGVVADLQGGESTYGDYPSYNARFTYGTDFHDGRGNIAFDFEWSKTDPLLTEDRPESARGYITAANPAGSAPGIPAVVPVLNAAFWEFNGNGVIFGTPAPVPQFLVKSGGSALQFSRSGGLIPYNPGNVYGIPFASGGDGFPYRDLSALYAGVERNISNVVAHYDISDHVKFSTQLTYGKTDGDDPRSIYFSNTILNSASSGGGPIPFTKTNPYLTATDIVTLSAANPTFASGGPLFLSKLWNDLPNTRQAITDTKVYRGVFGLDGDFDAFGRNYYWSVSYSHGEVDGNDTGPEIDQERLGNALNSAVNSAGQIVCAINAPSVTQQACAPINPFGDGNVSAAAANYVTTLAGYYYRNTQDDTLATLGGSVVKAPAGDVKFSVAFEHRSASARFDPTEAEQDGLIESGVPTLPQHGSYTTNEYATELLIPLAGREFVLPLVQAFDVNGAFRHVDNTISNSENVWDAGVRWQVIPDVSLRGSVSRNFRAPTLNDLYTPSSTGLGSIGALGDPCDQRYIGRGPNPTLQAKTCAALFAAHPQWGPLADFQDPAVNFDQALIKTTGNSQLQNEVSHTTSFGIVLQPRFAPGLSLSADRIMIHLTEAISLLDSSNFLQLCMDTVPQPVALCNMVTRDPATGYVATGVTTYYNAGFMNFHGEDYKIAYHGALSSLFNWAAGIIDLRIDATHTSLLDTSVTGFDLTTTSGTIGQPNWVAHAMLSYNLGAWRVSYDAYYRGRALYVENATYLTTPTPFIASNTVQGLSGEYSFDHFTIRAGLENIFNERPSYPTLSYGDIIGRQFFVGIKAHY